MFEKREIVIDNSINKNLHKLFAGENAFHQKKIKNLR